MTQPVIDTLRLADRLKESGFQDTQAEGLARALGGEFTGHVVTKTDLDSAIQLIRADYRALDEKFEAKFSAFEAKLGALEAKLGAFEAKFSALDGKVETKIDSLSMQIKFMFAALAALLALGLIDTVQRLLG